MNGLYGLIEKVRGKTKAYTLDTCKARCGFRSWEYKRDSGKNCGLFSAVGLWFVRLPNKAELLTSVLALPLATQPIHAGCLKSSIPHLSEGLYPAALSSHAEQEVDVTTKKGRPQPTGPSKSGKSKTSAEGSTARLGAVTESSSQIVKEAASLLEEEVASGIVAAKRVQERFDRERRVDPADFKESVTRLQAQAHDVVNQFSSQLSDPKLQENVDLLHRFVSNSHDLVDLAVEMLNTNAELADQLVRSDLLRRTDTTTVKTDAGKYSKG